MSEKKLNTKEKAILKVLHENKRPLTISKVARLAGISWNTAEKYLDEFHDREWIVKYQKGERHYYSAYQFWT